MKALKLLATIGLILVANAAIADTPSATYAGVNAYSNNPGSSIIAGTALVQVLGSNGTYVESYASGSTGDFDDVTEVEDVYTVVLVTVAGYVSTFTSECTVVIPDGMTGTASYSLSAPSSSGYTGLAKVTIGSTTVQASSSSSTTGTVTLEPGTYSLAAFSTISGSYSGSITAQIQLSIDEDE